MDLALTVSGLVIFVGLAALGLWRVEREHKDYTPGRPWRMPWMGIAILSVLVVVVLFAHLISLVTGQTLQSRFLGM